MIVQGEKQTVKRFRGKGIKNGFCTKMQTILNRLHSFKTKKAESCNCKRQLNMAWQESELLFKSQ